MIKKFLLRWLGELPPCETCEVLKLELALAHNQNEKLLNSIITKPETPAETVTETPRPIGSKFVPWRVKQMELEKAERMKAEEIRKNFVKTETEELEREVLLEIGKI
jgi:hypothetical protein